MLVTSPAAGIPDAFYTLPEHQSYYSCDSGTGNINILPQKKKVFLFNRNDTLFIVASDPLKPFRDTVNYVYPFTNKDQTGLLLTRHSFDFDVFTTPFKFRSATAGIPAQLTTSFNAAFYAGYRSDYYTVKKHTLKAPVNLSKVNNAGFGIGAFAGFASANIKPEFVRNTITYEYDAVALNYGVAFLFGYRQISTGLAVGFDYLADHNKNNWIYQNKPWLGIFIGLNLN
ncbi:MAG: hypothetical protein V4658_01450 [Bacteroidota bacterium]